MKKRWHEVIPELDGQKIGCRSNQIVNTSVASNRLAEGVSDSSCPPASRRCLSVKGCWRWREAISDSWHAENKPVVIVVWICYFAIYLFIKLQSFFLSEFYTWSFVMVVLLFLITFIHVRAVWHLFIYIPYHVQYIDFFIKLQSFFLSEFYTCSFVMVVLLFLITFIHVRAVCHLLIYIPYHVQYLFLITFIHVRAVCHLLIYIPYHVQYIDDWLTWTRMIILDR